MNILLAILGTLISGGISAFAAAVLAKRAKQEGGLSQQLETLQEEMDRVRKHTAEIQKKVEEIETVKPIRAHGS